MRWLVPIIQENPIIFGAERIMLDEEYIQDFMKKLSAAHPRSLMSFKTHLLLSDESSEEVCGSSDQEIAWSSHQNITIDGMLKLSHCAEAFIANVPTSLEIYSQLQALDTSDWCDTHRVWLVQMKQWLERGYRVIIMREA